MLNDFHLSSNEVTIKGPYALEEFKNKFVGSSDKFPLFGDDYDFKEIIEFINQNQKKIHSLTSI